MIPLQAITFQQVKDPSNESIAVVAQLVLTDSVVILERKLAAMLPHVHANDRLRQAIIAARTQLLGMLWETAYGELAKVIHAIIQVATENGDLRYLSLAKDAMALLSPSVPAPAPIEGIRAADKNAEPQRRGEETWTKNLPVEAGYYWWWNGDRESSPIVTTILFSENGGYGRWRQTRFQPAAEMGGYWMRVIEPDLPHSS